MAKEPGGEGGEPRNKVIDLAEHRKKRRSQETPPTVVSVDEPDAVSVSDEPIPIKTHVKFREHVGEEPSPRLEYEERFEVSVDDYEMYIDRYDNLVRDFEALHNRNQKSWSSLLKKKYNLFPDEFSVFVTRKTAIDHTWKDAEHSTNTDSAEDALNRIKELVSDLDLFIYKVSSQMTEKDSKYIASLKDEPGKGV